MATDYTQQIVDLLDSLLKQYQPGGTYQKAQEAGLTQQKGKFMGETAQSLVSAGLAGTTAGAGAGERWEREVGAPSRLNISDIMSSRLAGLATAKAGYLQGAQQLQTQTEESQKNREAQEYLTWLQEQYANKRLTSQQESELTTAKIAAGWTQLQGTGEWRAPSTSSGGGGGGDVFGGGGGGGGGGGINYTTSLGGEENTPYKIEMAPFEDSTYYGKASQMGTPEYSDVYKGIVNEATGGYLGGLKTAAGGGTTQGMVTYRKKGTNDTRQMRPGTGYLLPGGMSVWERID